MLVTTVLTQYPKMLYNKMTIHNSILGSYGREMINALREPVSKVILMSIQTGVHSEIHDAQENLKDE